MPPAFPLTLALYAVACALYLSYTVIGGLGAERLVRVARLALLFAFLSHAVDIGFLCVHHIHPFVNGREVLSFISWLTVGGYLLTTLRYSFPVAGTLIVPVTIVLDVAARAAQAPSGPSHASTLLGKVHVGLATGGVAIFALAAVNAFVYLVAEGQLKRHHFGPLFKKGPPLELLDAFNRRCILLGFPLYTIAMVTGAVWLSRLPDPASHGLLRPEYALASVAWTLYASLLVVRSVAGWRGRRAAIVTLLGFGAALCVVAIYYLRSAVGA